MFEPLLGQLNDVPSGGRTRFNRLGIEVAPRKGCALLFFPGFVSGLVDIRAMHEARKAVDRKYVCQIWIRGGPLPAEAQEHDTAGAMGHRLLSALYAS